MAKRKRQLKDKFDLDIVIPVYGRPDLLEKCLAAVEATQGDIKAQIILVDDHGPEQDALGEVYRSLNGHSRVLRNQENMGFAWTVNRGIELGKAPLILVLNTDIELQPGALQAMIAEFEDEQVGVVGIKLLFPLDSTDPSRPAGAIQHAGLCIGPSHTIKHVHIGWSADNPKANQRRECTAVTGACLMTRRATYMAIKTLYKENGDPTGGAFNEVYGKGTYEDVEYCLAAQMSEFKVIYTPEAVAYHHVGASVIQAGESYPIPRNEMIFRARCSGMLQWDEWRFY